MIRLKGLALAFLFLIGLAAAQPVMAGTPTTVSNLMTIINEEKQKATYNINLNAPFNKDSIGIKEKISTETGELSVLQTIFDLPGRNGLDLVLQAEYRNRDAKLFNEGTRSNSLNNTYGQTVVAYYDVFDLNGYWLKTGGLLYTANQTIASNVQYGLEKWVFTGYLAYETGTSAFPSGGIYNATMEKNKAIKAKYIMGEGWTLDLPFLEVEGDSILVHLQNGSAYKADFKSSNGLEKYELEDLIFTKFTNFSSGNDTSAYRLYFRDGDEFFFSPDGFLLGQRDLYNNIIRYYYEDVDGLKVLTKIEDTVGRMLKISYNNSGTIFTLGNKRVTLVKKPIPGQTNKFYLSTFIDPVGREIKYQYTFDNAQFDLLGKNPALNTYANLVEIYYPTGAKTAYNYSKGRKNLGQNGSMEYFKVRERYDQDGERVANRLTYQYTNEPDGYPSYKVTTQVPETYRYESKTTNSKGLTTKYIFDGRHLNITIQDAGQRIIAQTDTMYHSQYKLPVQVKERSFNAQGQVLEKVDFYDYDPRGNVIVENHPAKASEYTSVERKIFYSFDSRYNLLLSKKYKQDANTTVDVKYTLTPDGKEVATEAAYANGWLLAHKSYTYDSFGNVTSTTVNKIDSENVTERYQYGSEYGYAYLTAESVDVRNADDQESTVMVHYAYDFNSGNKISETDGNGHTTSYQYDTLDRLTREIFPDKSSRSYKLDDFNNTMEVTNAKGNKLVYDYDGLGNLLNVIEPSKYNILVKMNYDENDNLILEQDGNRNLKRLTYDQLTRITGVSHTDKNGKILAETRVAYDEAALDRFGNPFFKVTVTKKGDQRDQINNYYFDTFDRLAILGRMNGDKEEKARYKYDYSGNKVEAVDFAGQKSQFQYDALGRIIKSTDAQGSSNKFKYDQLGNLVAQTDPTGQTIYFEYDSLGRKIVDKAPFEAGKYSITKYYYDNDSNLTKIIDPEGYETRQHFNERDFLTAVERVLSSKKSNITKYQYDREGNTTKVIKGLNSWTDTDYAAYIYQYDELNRLILMEDASKRKTLYEYDNNGNLVKLTDRNKVATTYLYDGLDRLVEKRNSKDGSKTAIKITYDKLGATRQMKDASGTTVFDYDNLGRLTTINYGNGINQKYTYDNADRINSLEVLQGSLKQMNLKYQYDKVGRLTRVSDNGKNFTYKYDAAGKLVEELNGVTGIRSDYRYYPSGNIKSLRHFNGKDITSSYEYRYDARGNQIQKDEGSGTTKYFYDSLSRIKTAMLPDSMQNYEYDDLENIKELTEIKGNKIEETSYQYDRDSRLLLQETQKGDENIQKRFTYDNVGNQLTKDEVVKRKGNFISSKNTTFDYNGFNQVERVKNPDGKYIEDTYNGNGLRTKKDFGDKAVNYYYNGGNIIMETDKDSRVTAKNIRGLRLISRENNPGQTNTNLLYYLHNAHGDVTQLVDEKGQVIKDYRYDPFGNEEDIIGQAFGGKQSTELWRQEVEKIDNPFRYAGEYLDEETGNYYLRARYYDPSIQRFINEDSYGVERGAGWSEHLYNYVGNNPINYIDPTGHISLYQDMYDRGLGSGVYNPVLAEINNNTAMEKYGYKDPVKYISDPQKKTEKNKAPVPTNNSVKRKEESKKGKKGIDPMLNPMGIGVKTGQQIRKDLPKTGEQTMIDLGKVAKSKDVHKSFKNAIYLSISYHLAPIPGFVFDKIVKTSGDPTIDKGKKAADKVKMFSPSTVTDMVNTPKDAKEVYNTFKKIISKMTKKNK